MTESRRGDRTEWKKIDKKSYLHEKKKDDVSNICEIYAVDVVDVSKVFLHEMGFS
jgi:hypothetical protein